MGKIIGIGLWVCIVTLGAVYGAIHLATAPAEPSPEDAKKAALELSVGEGMTIPIISNGDVSGYFITRISFMMDKEKTKGKDLPIKPLLTDQLFTLLIGNKMVDIQNVRSFELQAFKDKIREGLNEGLGDELVVQVIVEQLDYVSKEAARKAADGAKGPMDKKEIVAGEKPPETAPPAAH